MDIRLIKQEDIDKTKWNSCVHYAPNGNIFGYKWYLDNVAKDWDGLVEGDYESVFPLIHTEKISGWLRKKSTILHQPDLIRTSGLYSIPLPSEKRIRSFLEAIPSTYQQQDISLGEGTKAPSHLAYTISERCNYMLLLQEPYDTLAANYSLSLQQALERANLSQLLPIATGTQNLKPEKLTDFYLRESTDKKKFKNAKSHALLRIMYNALHRGWGFASGVVNRQQELLAVNFFLISHKRIMSLMPVESKAGAQVGAMAFLFDLLMRTQANKPMLLDFNVREESALAQDFGALKLPYSHLTKH